jgi:hypothetical protein
MGYFRIHLSHRKWSTVPISLSYTTPLVGQAAATGDRPAMQKQIGEAMFVAVIMGTLGMILMMAVRRWVTLRARWVTLRARWVTLRARWVTLRARWVTLRAR